MTSNELEELVQKCLDDFYRRRKEGLITLKLRDVLRKKNPYLLRAIGIEDARAIVTSILQAHMSSSDEGIFGDAFFEPIARVASGGAVSPSDGVDVAVETELQYKAISVKSGPNPFNSSQTKRMNQEFMTLRSRLSKTHKSFDALLGSCYGRKSGEASGGRIYRIRSGQAFWTELTGDPQFYLTLLRLMRDGPLEHAREFDVAWQKAINLFEAQFLSEFMAQDGGIDWDALLRFNSGVDSIGSRKKIGR